MQEENWITKLYGCVSDASFTLEIMRDYDNEGNNRALDERKNRLTDLEKQIYDHLHEVWTLCRKHPEFWEPNPKDNPEMFDADGDLLPDLGEVKPFDYEEHKRIEAQFDSAIRNALKNFTKDTHLQKKAFAEAYGIAISYLSRIISGDKDFDFKKILSAGEKLGCTLSFSPADKTAKFVKKI